MSSETVYALYIGLLLLTVPLAGWISLAAWRRRAAPGALALAVILGGAAWWSLSFAIELLPVVDPIPIFWFKLMFAGVVVVPAAFFVFGLEYAGYHRYVNRTILALLTVEPILFPKQF